MSDLEALFLILSALYLAECALWVRRETVSFRSVLGRTAEVVDGTRLIGGPEGGVLLANPLPPFGFVLVCQHWPLSVAPDGVYSYTALASNPGRRARQVGRFVRFDDIERVEAEGAEVRIDGAGFLIASSARLARHLAELIETVRALPPDGRARAIDAEIERIVDMRAVAERRGLFFAARTRVLLASSALFAHLFVAAPVAFTVLGIERTWILVLATFVVLLALAVLAFDAADRALYPGPDATRWKRTALLAVTPLSAIRAVDVLARDLVCTFHPLAVASVFASPGTAREQAGRFLRDAQNPRLPVCPASDPAACAVEAWFRTRLAAALERACAGSVPLEGLDPARAPSAADAGGAYCPRCLAEYVAEGGTCYDCGGIPLRALAAAASHADRR